MLVEIVPKIGRNYQPIFRTFRKVITGRAVRPICTSNNLSKERNPAWDYIVPMIMRVVRSNMAKRKDTWGSKGHRHWQDQCSDQDWQKWEKVAKDIEKVFSDGSVSEMIRGEKVRYDGSIFEVKLDIQTFSPEELQVKVSGNKLTVKGKHGRKEDEYGSVSREFHRDFTIPEDVNKDTFESSISDDGILTLKADVLGEGKGAKKIDIKFESRKED